MKNLTERVQDFVAKFESKLDLIKLESTIEYLKFVQEFSDEKGVVAITNMFKNVTTNNASASLKFLKIVEAGKYIFDTEINENVAMAFLVCQSQLYEKDQERFYGILKTYGFDLGKAPVEIVKEDRTEEEEKAIIPHEVKTSSKEAANMCEGVLFSFAQLNIIRNMIVDGKLSIDNTTFDENLNITLEFVNCDFTKKSMSIKVLAIIPEICDNIVTLATIALTNTNGICIKISENGMIIKRNNI